MATTDLVVSFYIGNRHVIEFSIIDEDTSGSPALDITGKVLKFALSKFSGSTPKLTPEFEKSTSDGITITSGAGGVCEVEIDEADTLGFKPGDYYFELELFDSGGLDPLVVATGTITLLLNVTNS